MRLHLLVRLTVMSRALTLRPSMPSDQSFPLVSPQLSHTSCSMLLPFDSSCSFHSSPCVNHTPLVSTGCLLRPLNLPPLALRMLSGNSVLEIFGPLQLLSEKRSASILPLLLPAL